MTEFKAAGRQSVQKRKQGNSFPLESKIPLLFLGLLSISFLGYFAFQELWVGFIFAHAAALSIMGFYGCLAGSIAKKKGYSYPKAFQIGFFPPIILGGISAFLLVPSGEGDLPLTCGGLDFPHFRGHAEKFDIISSLEVSYGRTERSSKIRSRV